MSDRARLLLSWVSTDGTKRCILSVTDESLEEDDNMHRRIEYCSYNSDEDEWNTNEVFDYIDEIEDIGLPEEFDP
jgi:hypothetical protein